MAVDGTRMEPVKRLVRFFMNEMALSTTCWLDDSTMRVVVGPCLLRGGARTLTRSPQAAEMARSPEPPRPMTIPTEDESIVIWPITIVDDVSSLCVDSE